MTAPPGAAVGPEEFAARLDRLGPFEPAPRLAVAVSGGADSTALALLADRWARDRGGSILALVVDHGLRAEAAADAALTATRLAARGISGRVLALDGLRHGPALAARARAKRYDALERACRDAGIVHLLLGHHAGDQAETAEMRARAASGGAGRAAMSSIRETSQVRLLRPLLDILPGSLRATLHRDGVAWIEDPSNHDQATLRARLREELHDPGAVACRADAARDLAVARRSAELGTADALAGAVAFHPGGYAVVCGALPADALAATLTAVGGAAWPPSARAVARLARAMGPATLGGARVLAAGRLCPGGWLVAREAAAMAPPVAAVDGAVWDGRFRLRGAVAGATLGALGGRAAGLRARPGLPRAVLETLPALTRDGALLGAPHVAQSPDVVLSQIVWSPRRPCTTAPFAPAFG